jgi:hypothetical protein
MHVVREVTPETSLLADWFVHRDADRLSELS